MAKVHQKVRTGLLVKGITAYPSDAEEGDLVFRSDLFKYSIYRNGNWADLLDDRLLQVMSSNDSTSSGAQGLIAAPTTPFVRLTNSGLTGAAGISAGVNGQVVTFTNTTANTITLFNNGATNIFGQQLTGFATITAVNGTNQWPGQTFKALTSGSISDITLKMQQFDGFDTGTITLKLFATAGGLPTGAALGTSNSVNVSTISNLVTTVPFHFSTPVSGITSGTTYAFVVDTHLVVYSDYLYLCGATSDVYADGAPVISGNSGASYTFTGFGDAYFDISGSSGVGVSDQILTGGASVALPPDASAILIYDGASSRWRVISAPTSNVLDTAFNIVDVTDQTKKINFDAAGTSGTKTTLLSSQTANRILTLPDITDTLVSRTNTDFLQNKKIAYTSSDNSTGGSSLLINPSTGMVRLTGGSLVSVGGIINGVTGQQFVLENVTGNSVQILNDANTGAEIDFVDHSTIGVSDGTPLSTSTTNWIGQTFTAAGSGNLTIVDIGHLVPNGVTGFLTCRIYATSGGFPSGAQLGSAVSPLDIGGSNAQIFTFSPTIPLVNGTVYAAVFDTASLTYSPGPNVIFGASSVNEYAGGTAIITSTGSNTSGAGGGWSNVTNHDLRIKIYQPAAPGYIEPANRILTGTSASFTMPKDSTLEFFYDTTTSKWRMLSGGGAGNGGAKNYLTAVVTNQSTNPNPGNGNFELGSTQGWSLAHTALSAGLYPTSVASAGVGFDSTHGGSAASGNLSFTTVTSTSALAGAFSGSLVSSAAGVAGDLFITSPFYIDSADQAKILYFSFDYKAISGTFNLSGTSANTFAVYIYDVTNAAWIQPVGVYNMVLGQGVGVCAGSFQTTTNSTQYQLAVVDINAPGSAFTMYFDDFAVGGANGAASNIIVSQSPTIQKFLSGSATYTTPAGVQWLKVKLIGGGGGGSGGGTTGATNGSAGGVTTFGSSLLTGNGGGGGTFNGGSLGGTASISGPAIGTALTGGAGGLATSGSSGGIMGPSGGNGPFGGAGGGGSAVIIGQPSGQAGASNTGGGGGGGGSGTGAGTSTGTAGSAGGYVEAVIANPAATYTYSVGGGGSAGSAGAGSAGNGGGGGSGIIIVEEHYSTPGAANGINGSGVIAASATNNSGTHTANGSFQDISTWNAPSVDTYGAFNTSNGLYTIPVAGIYQIESTLAFASNSTGERVIKLVVNGSTQIAWNETPGNGSFQVGQSVSVVYAFRAGDTVKMQAFQNSGGNLAYGSNVGGTTFSIACLSSANNTVGLTSTKIAPTKQQWFSGSGTYIVPTGPVPLYIVVKMVAGGGGGFGATNNSAGNPALSGAGNGGASIFGSANCGGGGAANGDTYSNNFQSGGSGGGNTTGGYPGWGVNGGAGGGNNNADNSTGNPKSGGEGGTSFYGGTAPTSGCGVGVSPAGNNGSAPGAGGSGAASFSNAGKRSGSGGGAGGYVELVISGAQLLAFIASPPSWQVGGGGAGGGHTAGGGASNGGNGNGGQIIVDEYYQ